MCDAITSNLTFLSPGPVRNRPIRLEKPNPTTLPGSPAWVLLPRTFNVHQVTEMLRERPDTIRVYGPDAAVFAAEQARVLG